MADANSKPGTRPFALDKDKLAALVPLLGRLGAKGLVGAARVYLGPLAERAAAHRDGQPVGTVVDDAGRPLTPDKQVAGLDARELAILGLAATKLVFEIGELALYNPQLEPAGKQPEFKLDEAGRAPALSLAHVLAAARLWRASSADAEVQRAEGKRAPAVVVGAAPVVSSRARLYAARSEYYAATSRYAYAAPAPRAAAPVSGRAFAPAPRAAAPMSSRALASAPATPQPSRGTPMTTTPSSYTRGCPSCGGNHGRTAAPPSAGPCAGGLPAAAVASERCSASAGCGCSACSAQAPAPSKTYDSAQCPTFAISCETKLALRECVKTALCDFLRCVSDTLCPGGRFDSDVFDSSKNPNLGKELVDCVGQLACSFIHCVPEVLCPEPPALPAPVDCLPCGYAVENEP